MKARDVMTWGAIAVKPDESVARAVQLMLQNKISGLPVVDGSGHLEDVVRLMERHRVKRLPVVQDGKLVGMVSRADLLHALGNVARELKPVAGDDATIREQIIAECAKQPWASRINVVVRDGVVGLWGVITDDRKRDAFIVAAENVPGVKDVHDHLAWIEPMSGMVLLSEKDEKRARAS